MEYPLPSKIIKQQIEQTGVDPALMLAYLLHVMGNHQHLNATAHGFAKGAGNTSNVFDEIMSLSKMEFRGDKAGQIPESLLAAVQMYFEFFWTLDRANLQQQKHQNAPVDDRFEKKVVAGEALMGILKEYSIQLDQSALETRIKIEDMAKEKGWNLNPPGPDAPKDD